MNNRVPAIISTVSNSFCDFTLDYAINKYNLYKVLFGVTLGAFIIQLIYGFIVGIEVTTSSLIYIIINSISLLLGYIFYVDALTRLPIALIALIESGSLFIYLIIDTFSGYLKVNLWFISLFILFLFSIILFTYDTYKFKDIIKNKDIKLVGILILLASMLFYGLEPYLIKFASINGANEVGINLGYYILSVPFFFYMYLKNKNKDLKKSNNKKLILFITLIASLEAIYYLFGTIGYMLDAAVINAIIEELRVFLLFILSIIFKTDIITFKKIIALIIGVLSVIGIYLY